MQTHPDQEEPIYEHQKEINEKWNALTSKVSLIILVKKENLVRIANHFGLKLACAVAETKLKSGNFGYRKER